MNEFTIFIASNEHPRTINTPMNGRTYYSVIRVEGKAATINKVRELRAEGKRVLEVRTPCYHEMDVR